MLILFSIKNSVYKLLNNSIGSLKLICYCWYCRWFIIDLGLKNLLK